MFCSQVVHNEAMINIQNFWKIQDGQILNVISIFFLEFHNKRRKDTQCFCFKISERKKTNNDIIIVSTVWLNCMGIVSLGITIQEIIRLFVLQWPYCL